ncbi:MAG TPA: hypothetical protein PKE40_05470 [Arachnia sp.]|nr:hypothetical protein [Arachnia sp.]HMT85785.1 hypothetical protein [Arachnia sp.]
MQIVSRPTSGHRPRRRPLAALTAAALALGCIATGAQPAHAADPDILSVDFSVGTGAVKGGASGMLYGLSDHGVPTDAIIAGAGPRNITQKAPHGAQHPNGDPLDVEEQFFANGGEYLITNIQDYYPDWSYNGGQRPADFTTYLDIVRTVVTSIRDESAYPEKYYFVPFNEPDGGNWYANWATMKDTFLADWKAVYETIKEVYPEARIAGMGDTGWRSQRTRDILTFARDNDVLPDMFTWHELGIDNLRTYRSHYADYRQIERDLGIGPLPVNITEYAMRRDMSVPGQLIQWLAMFEDTKVDAQTAYWTYAGNLNDNMTKNNEANGAWWLLKWYGDLTGDTVRLTPPALNVADTIQGIAALDEDKAQATVLFGGGSRDIRLDLTGLDADLFGDEIDIQIREAEWTGQEGEALAPRVVAATRTSLDDTVSITVPNDDRLSAFQLVVTPALGAAPVVDSTWRSSIEAEDTVLANVQTYGKPMSDAWTFAASGQRDVGSTNKVGSSLTWAVTVPETGTYRFGAIAGINGPSIGPGQHALFVDGVYRATVNYEAGFSWGYRGRAEADVSLTAGAHQLSLRMSANGTSLLPGSDISLDKFDLTHVDGPERSLYPANLARLDGAAINHGPGRPAGTVRLSGDASATFFVAVRETGYYDVELGYRADGAAQIGLDLNGRAISGLAVPTAGSAVSTARVHLAAGVSRFDVSANGAIDLVDLTTVRAAEGDTAVRVIEMEDATAVTLSGGARVESVSQPTNISGSQVGWLGGSAASKAVVARPSGLAAGQYDFVARYANAERNTGHAYNTDVITRFLDVTEAGGQTTRGAYRHNYSWKGFWSHTIPLDLVTDTGALTLGNATGNAPNLDWIALAPLVLGVSTTVVDEPASAPEVTVVPTTRCVAGKVVLAVSATNGEEQPLDVSVVSPYGSKSFPGLAAGRTSSAAFTTRQVSIPAGELQVSVTVPGVEEPYASSVPFEGAGC